MRPILTVFLVSGLFASCANEVSVDLQDPPPVKDEPVPPPSAPPVKTPVVRPSFRKAVQAILEKNKYRPAIPDTFEVVPQNDFFSLFSASSFFTPQELIYLGMGESARVRLLVPGGAEIILEERILLSTQDVDKIIAAMSKPVSDPREERFLKRPFTFWQFENAICHLFTAEEKNRKAMDSVYEEWVNVQSPGE